MAQSYTSSVCCHVYRPLVQQKLDVLGKVGLSKDNFSNADTKYMQVRVFNDRCVELPYNYVEYNQNTDVYNIFGSSVCLCIQTDKFIEDIGHHCGPKDATTHQYGQMDIMA